MKLSTIKQIIQAATKLNKKNNDCDYSIYKIYLRFSINIWRTIMVSRFNYHWEKTNLLVCFQ